MRLALLWVSPSAKATDGSRNAAYSFCKPTHDILDIQGHRGARGLFPENTLPAFSRALEIGVTTLELDCGVTKDSVVVVSHDTALNPDFTRDARGQWLERTGPAIWHLAYGELQHFDVGRLKPGTAYAQRFPHQRAVDGTPVPRLEDVFALVQRSGNSSVRFNIETKLSPLHPSETPTPEAFVGALLQVIRQAGMEQRVSIQSFDWRTLQRVQKEAPSIPTVYLTAERSSPRNIQRTSTSSSWTAGHHVTQYAGSIPAMVKAAGGSVWSPDYNELTRETLKEAQALGLKVVTWTVNAEADMRRLIEWGVDGIISDYPDLLLELIREHPR
jgi:glycerophosphoryl diester phosphodiesterase